MLDVIQSYFTIELLSAVLLCVRKLPLRGRRRFLFAPLVLLLIFASMIRMGGRSLVDYGYLGGLLHYMAVTALTSGIVWLCFDATVPEALLYGVAAFAMQHFCHDFVMLVLQLARLNSGAFVQTPLYTVVRFAGMAATYALLYPLFVRKFKPDQEKIRSGARWAVLSATMLCLVCAMYGVLDRSGIEGFGSIVIHVYDALCTAFGMMLLMYVSENDALSGELNTLHRMWQMQRERYELARENVQLINVKCHDIRKHITALYAREAGRAPGERFVQEVERSIRIYDAIANTGCDSLDVILTEKSLFCEKHHIRMTCMADGRNLAFLEDVDLYCLFGNILDNAIESVRQIEDAEKRVINLDVRTSGDLLRIQEENYFSGTLRFEDGLPITTKADRDQHGFGMKSIRLIVDKYGGEMEITARDGVFSLNILLPIRRVGVCSTPSLSRIRT